MSYKDREYNNRYQREWARKERAKNPGRSAKYLREWRRKNPEWRIKARGYARKYYAKNRDRALARGRVRYRERYYGLSAFQFDELLARQKGVCAICSQPETHLRRGRPLPLCVDHCHKTGRVRGLLCHECNWALGKFKDSQELLQKALNYLTS